MQQYLDVVGLRVIGGYDVADRHAREHPDLLVKIVRSRGRMSYFESRSTFPRLAVSASSTLS